MRAFAFMFCGLFAMPSAASVSCQDYAKQFRWIANVPNVTTSDFVVVGDLAYVTSGAGLQILDVSAPLSPLMLGAFSALGPVTGVDVSGHFAFLAVSDSALAAVDVSDPHQPVLVGSVQLAGWPQNVTVRNDAVFVPVLDHGVFVFDAGDPTALALVGSVPLQTAYDVEVRGSTGGATPTWAYVAAGHSGVAIVDVTDPAHSVLATSIPFSDSAIDVEVVGDILYVAASAAGFGIVDVGIPAAPQVLSNPPAGRADRVHIEGTKAYVGGTRGEVLLFDVGDPTQPTRLAKAGTPGFGVNAIASVGSYLYAGLGSEGLGIIDRTFEETILPITTVATSYTVRDFTSYGNIAVGSWLSWAQLYDISDPDQPSALGGYNPPGNIEAVALDGQRLYILNSTANLIIVDATDPNTPQLVSTLALGTSGGGCILVDGSLVWAAMVSPLALRAVDVSDPTLPVIVGTASVPGIGTMCRVGDLLYLGLENKGLVIVDVSNPTAPVVIATLPSIGAHAIATEGALLYGAYDRDFGIWTLDDPVAPALLGSVKIVKYALSMVVDGGLVYVESRLLGPQVVDVSDPVHPRLIGTPIFLDASAEYSIALHEGRVYVPANTRIGVFAAQCASTALSAPEPRREPAFSIAPNPFRGATTFTVASTGIAPLKVDIYDVCGRQIRTLVGTATGRGSVAVTWSGDNGQGDPVATGVYFVRVNVDGTPQTARVVRTR